MSGIFLCLLIFIGWFGYGLIHSALASGVVKNSLKPAIEKTGIRYRLFYVILACIIPLPLIWVHMTSDALWIWPQVYGLRLFGGLIAGLGLALLRKAFSSYDSRLFFGLSNTEDDSESLKTSGLLSQMRHPLYTATLMILWGWLIFSPTYQNLSLASSLTIYILIGIKWEEKKLIKQYGEAYREYMEKTPMLIPKFGSKS
ncbi:methyltransferase family protein [Jiulongibacter sp. NS-SX5]|uniref:methyltransferase family protein n=1 Tax=Jiulongibacter sp. NS-SX5 TaxID=3463854 RepID=UPI004057E3AB